ncbi:MAG: hypothetical protein KDD55_12725, partial [Bdellovibrionales bacterium]|nr:hypothetical protein [Bdellovibrionales bacterium]
VPLFYGPIVGNPRVKRGVTDFFRKALLSLDKRAFFYTFFILLTNKNMSTLDVRQPDEEGPRNEQISASTGKGLEHHLSPPSAPTYDGRALTPNEATCVLRMVAEGVDILERKLTQSPQLFTKPPLGGHELEYVLMDALGRPNPAARHLIAAYDELKAELSAFNLETDSCPLPINEHFLRGLAEQLSEKFDYVLEVAKRDGHRAALVGILPGYTLDDFGRDNFINARYRNLDAAIKELSPTPPHRITLDGPEGITAQGESLLFEAMNTSLQLHLSVSPDDMVTVYNIVQAVTAPLLAASTNSSIVLGKKCWMESRIPIWRQATLPEQVPFGERWITDPIETLRELVQFHPILMDVDTVYGPPPSTPKEQEARALTALGLQNGVVWRWNRVCFSADEGTEHIRIENRTLPAGPTTLDMAANAAFFYGLAYGFQGEQLKPQDVLQFEDVKANFYHSARLGLDAALTWYDLEGEKITLSAKELALQLLDTADKGLAQLGILKAERDFYLRGILRKRIETESTGAHWMIRSLDSLERKGVSIEEAIQTIADEMQRNQITPSSEWKGYAPPVHAWGVL